MGKSDPFLQLSKVKSDGGTLLVHRTEVSWVERNETTTTTNIQGNDFDPGGNSIVTSTLYTFADLNTCTFVAMSVRFGLCVSGHCKDAMGGVGGGSVDEV